LACRFACAWRNSFRNPFSTMLKLVVVLDVPALIAAGPDVADFDGHALPERTGDPCLPESA
jgi:hypothetical protein